MNSELYMALGVVLLLVFYTGYKENNGVVRVLYGIAMIVPSLLIAIIIK